MLLKRKFWIFCQFLSVFFVFICVTNYLKFYPSKKHSFKVVKSELKDWNDYEQMRKDSQRSGFGEHGKGEKLTDANEAAKNEQLYREYGMSVVISDKISVNRSIPEFRHPKCLGKRYFKELPKVSIIIIFVDEVFSVFKRTLHSLYNRTPHELIEEVILVNDHSTKEYLYEPLRIYIDENFHGIKFNIINLKRRHGLMQARVVGARAAKSEFLFITEPHCEFSYNWLPPLLQPLLETDKTVTVPIIDNIEWHGLEYYENDKGSKGSRGVFNWDLEYQKLNRFPSIDSDKELDPFPIPVMTGGIYMSRKSYFFEIGPYDPQLTIWGAENIEMSLKINLCGGQLLEVPCSHIGHIFRAFTRSRKHPNGIDFEGYNRKRVVEVWFDDYKSHVYKRHQARYDKIDVGDLTQAIKLKTQLNCKPFEYFLVHVAPDLLEKFPLSQFPFAYGQIQLLDRDYCLNMNFSDDLEPKEVTLEKCADLSSDGLFHQYFELSWYRDIRLRGNYVCIDAYELSSSQCHTNGGNQHFKYDIRTNQISNVFKKLCIEANIEDKSLKLAKCDESLTQQRWIFNEFMNETALNDWNNSGRPFKGGNRIFWDE